MDRAQRQALQDRLSASSSALITDIAERQQRYDESGEAADALIERQQRGRHVVEEAPQVATFNADAWLKAALRAEREKIFEQVLEGINARTEVIFKEVERAASEAFAELRGEIAELRALIVLGVKP